MDTITLIRGSDALPLETRQLLCSELAKRMGVGVRTRKLYPGWDLLGYVEYEDEYSINKWYACLNTTHEGFEIRYLDVGELNAA